MYLLLLLIAIFLIKWSLAPRTYYSRLFVIYKISMIILTWTTVFLIFAGKIPWFVGPITGWIMLLAAVLFVLPTFMTVKKQ